ncbi:hypothetical protein ADL04_28470 [Streptomyces sp. NRRL B-3648]|nr:hypothetical protein ADL04_28470 [Streptomyces sp. NRRL B-3648]
MAGVARHNDPPRQPTTTTPHGNPPRRLLLGALAVTMAPEAGEAYHGDEGVDRGRRVPRTARHTRAGPPVARPRLVGEYRASPV